VAITNPSRHAFRTALVGLLAPLATGANALVQKIYDHSVGDFSSETPVICIDSDGALRHSMNLLLPPGTLYLSIHVFVLYSDPEGTWTEEQSQDALDAIEAAVTGLIEDHYYEEEPNSYPWEALGFADRSMVDDVLVGEVAYRHEVIPLVIKAKRDQ
jgi:hypothetical protein